MTPQRTQYAQQLVSMVTQMVNQSSWAANGNNGTATGKTAHVATLNGTLATTRWIVALLETHQHADGADGEGRGACDLTSLSPLGVTQHHPTPSPEAPNAYDPTPNRWSVPPNAQGMVRATQRQILSTQRQNPDTQRQKFFLPLRGSLHI